MAYYDQDGTPFHRLMTIKTSPDGTYNGDFVFIEKFIPMEVNDYEADTINPESRTL
ncbi:hypothetical protein DFO70_11775 [Cytobacillus firmus]|uniref:Uncharacterized protein n=2 Tax=Cytobacillus TaxID=2675230 RepID=A0A366JK91_CYTFI|nr:MULTISPECIES: hypothetical protein [Cytobacillus]RBP87884.1 hypothetical protein DFO70_11775 [Cytobacillus firmus]TDX39247.1 hypothetical protein DFO72_11177 [Cytobacillus oceanisediminis]